MRLLQELVKEDIQIVAIVVDQRAIVKTPDEKENIYRKAVSRAIYHLVRRWPRNQICLDQRYTKNQLRFELEKRIREEIDDLHTESSFDPAIKFPDSTRLAGS